MKNKILQTLLIAVLCVFAMPSMAQNYMNVYFKNGDFRKIYLNNLLEIAVSKYDEEGVLHSNYDYQHVKTLHNKYVYNLQDVDSVTFTKYDEEKVRESFENTMPEVFKILSKCEDITDANNLLDSFKKSEGVEDAWTEGNMLYVKIPSWNAMTFYFNKEETENEVAQARAMLPSITRAMESNGKKIKAVVANQRGFDFNQLEKDFRSCNVEVCPDNNMEPTLDFFLSGIYQYDLVFLFTHGGYWNGNHWLLTSEELGTGWSFAAGEEPSKISDEIRNAFNTLITSEKYKDLELTEYQDVEISWSNTSGPKWNAYIAISEKCIKEKSIGQFPTNKSILFNGACVSLQYSNSLADIYLDERNLGVYYGYDESNAASASAGRNFFTSLLAGKSVNKAYNDIPEKYRDESGLMNPLARWIYQAKLLPVTRKSEEECNTLFLFPTTTIKIDQLEAMNGFNTTKSVEVEGYATSLDPSKIKCGFIYSTSEDLRNHKTIIDDNPTHLITTSKQGNVKFRASLTELEPNNTYYYRAYTFDGVNYNYGEPCSFEIEQGGGDLVAYTSCPDGNHPHMIDLGLPSGTKWSCCNVGASVPTAYGNYYAWGETSTKSTYTKENYKYHHTDSDGKYVYDDATFTMAPTPDQVKELFANCTATETSVDGVAGEKLTSKKNGKKIFLPYGGAKGTSTVGVGEEYQYWTSQLEKSASNSKLLAPRQYSDNETDDLGNPYAFDWYEKDFRYIGKTVRKASK